MADRRSYWLDMSDRTLVAMTKGLGADLTNDQKRTSADLRREHLIDQVCVHITAREVTALRIRALRDAALARQIGETRLELHLIPEVAMISPAKKRLLARPLAAVGFDTLPALGKFTPRLRLFAAISARHRPIVGSTMASSHGHRPGGDRLWRRSVSLAALTAVRVLLSSVELADKKSGVSPRLT